MSNQEPVPAFCTCGRTKGFMRSPRTGFWICDYCGCPREVWWRGQKKKIDRLARKGLCSKDAGVQSFTKRACAAAVRHGQ